MPNHTMNVIGVRPPQCCLSPPHATASLATASTVSCTTSPNQLCSSFLQRAGSIAASRSSSSARSGKASSTVVCGLGDYWGGDLLGFDLGKWQQDVEDYGAIAIYPPAEGGYEGRYAVRLKEQGYHFMNMSARGLGDLESHFLKVHGVRPAHLGKQAITTFYRPPELDYRLSCLPKGSKGIVLWIIEAQVLSKQELQFLCMLPALRKNVRVIAECGTWRSFRWKPLREVAGLPVNKTTEEPSGIPVSELLSEVQNTPEPSGIPVSELQQEEGAPVIL